MERRSSRAEEEYVLGLIEALAESAKAPAVPLRQTAALERLSKAHPKHLADLGDANLLALVLRRLAVGRPVATRIWVLRERARVWTASRGMLFKRRLVRRLAIYRLV